jgi:phosphate:Na+ symporter
MTGGDVAMMIFGIAGGLALFILGMNIMSGSLRAAAGKHLRKVLARATRRRDTGIALGTLIGFLIHSSAATVMLVGFINAGLITLSQSIAPMLGANIGTTLSMQLISFKLGDYCFAAIALGFLLSVAAPRPALKQSGRALMGFGLLFLGMNTMSAAIEPYRATFAPWLARADGSTLGGMLLGVLLAAGVTAVIQSSGATIGMGFALISAGVITTIEGIFPIIVGANIGTCVTALLGSIGTNIDARRNALAHLFFNIYSAAAAILAAPLFYRYIPASSSDLIHQAANANTVKMLATALPLLPFIAPYTRLVRLMTPSQRLPEPPSRLDPGLIDKPESAIYAALKELQRVGNMCIEGYDLNLDYLQHYRPEDLRRIKLLEQNVDEIKAAMKDYVAALTARNISRRQAMLLLHVDRCMSDVERIGDHVERLSEITLQRRKLPRSIFDRDLLELWYRLHREAGAVLRLGIKSLDPDCGDPQEMAGQVLAARDQYSQVSQQAKSRIYERVESHTILPLAAVNFREYLAIFDRMVKHIKSIAQEEMQPYFHIKTAKLEHPD